jgi:hypothetical protein
MQEMADFVYGNKVCTSTGRQTCVPKLNNAVRLQETGRDQCHNPHRLVLGQVPLLVYWSEALQLQICGPTSGGLMLSYIL